jgi:hypothetical protein
MSYAMDERQASRENGQYKKMFRCEVCKKPLGADYYSAPSSGITGKGLTLCKVCCKAWEMADELESE